MRGRIAWYVNRFRAMSLEEVGYRLVQSLRRMYYRWRRVSVENLVGKQKKLPVIPALLESARSADLSLFVDDSYTLPVEGRFRALGREWQLAEGRDRWHQDPESLRLWPQHKFSMNIDFRQGNPIGDPKYVWELNRLQHLQPLAAQAAVEGRAELARYCVDEILSWIAANPAYLGVNWSSGIELSLRIVSICTVSSFLEPHFSSEEKKAVIASLASHGFWIERFLSLHSSANNHLIAEAAGLYFLGCLLPDLTFAAAWRETGQKILEAQSGLQFYPDGIGAEQSITYSCFSLEWFALCADLAKRTGSPLGGVVKSAVLRGGRALHHLADNAGHFPRIGDDDEGRVLWYAGPANRYPLIVIGYSASLLRDETIAGALDNQNFGSLFFPPFRAGEALRPKVHQFPSGGYTSIRERIDGREIFVVFDHGPLGYLSLSAHGHADALSLWVHIDGQPALVDAGTYTYNPTSSWREHFKSTLAHNTLTVGGTSSSTMAGSFNWSRKAAVKLTRFVSDGSIQLEAEHDGYRADFGVTHRRAVLCRNEKIVVTDTLLDGRAPHSVEVNWLFHPSLDLEISDGVVRVLSSGKLVMTLLGSELLTPTLVRGSTDPMRGWYSERMGSKCPAFQCSFRGVLAAGDAFSTTFCFNATTTSDL